MAQEHPRPADRVWFDDSRTPARRMGVSSHPAEGIIVVSFWQGELCTATFRLPLADGAGLIAAVAEGMAAGLPAPTPGPGYGSDAGPRPRRWPAWLEHRIRRFRRPAPPGLRVVR